MLFRIQKAHVISNWHRNISGFVKNSIHKFSCPASNSFSDRGVATQRRASTPPPKGVRWNLAVLGTFELSFLKVPRNFAYLLPVSIRRSFHRAR